MTASAQIEFVQAFRLPAGARGNGIQSLIELVKQRKIELSNTDQDVELIRRIGARDAQALAEFYDRYSALMFSVAFKILNDSGEAEDVLQEAFEQIWVKAGRFDPKLGRPASWAAILARNRAIDHLRASIRRTRLADNAAEQSITITPALETANNVICGNETAGLIQSAISELPEEQRRAIELAYFSGLTQNEISEQLQEPLGTIKARIRRGLLKLRDLLEGNL